MQKFALVLVVAVVAVAAFFLLRTGGTTPVGDDGAEDAASTSSHAPKALRPLETAPGGPTKRQPAQAGMGGGESDAPANSEGDTSETGKTFEVLVLEDDSGRPVEKALVAVRNTDGRPCPPTSVEPLLELSLAAVTTASRQSSIMNFMTSSGVTDAQGRFSTKWIDQSADVVVRKKGFVVGVACARTPGIVTTVRLVRGLSIAGLVVGLDDKPVANARVDAGPLRGIPATPGHREYAMTDENGAFAVEGLLAGSYDLVVSHPWFMPETRPGIVTGRTELKVVLRPAFAVTFRITTENLQPPETPTVGWSVVGVPPWEGVEMLQPPRAPEGDFFGDGSRSGVGLGVHPQPPAAGVDAAGAAPGTFVYAPIRIPAGRPTAVFTVKALGMEPWISQPIEVPAGGGETSIDVSLRHDPDLGNAKIVVESRDHQTLSFQQERCRVAIGRRDGKAVGAGVVYQPGDELTIQSIPSGPYRIVIRSPLHAPATADFDVPAAGLAEAKVTLGPPAKLRIKATASEATVVTVQLRQGREIVHPFIDRATATATPGPPPPGRDEEGPEQEPGESQSVASGADGILLTGLPAGRVSIEVTSAEWTAPPTSVDLVEGDTRDVEMVVTRR